jgi:CRP-like cAMP-binding protein
MDKTELLKMLSQESHARRYVKGQVIVQDGAPADEGLAFLLAGEAKVIQNQGEKRILIGFIKAGQFFGETALVLNRPRMATVESNSDETIVLFMESSYFRNLASKNHQFLELLIRHTISRIEFVMNSLFRQNSTTPIQVEPSLHTIITENRRQVLKLQDLLNHTRSAWIGHGKSVFHQGDKNSNDIYLVVKGSIRAVREFEGTQVNMFLFQEGDIFGYSRLNSTPVRRYSAIAESDSARIITFDDELVGRLLRMNQDLFYFVFRSMITQLVILDDALRLASAQRMAPLGASSTEAQILNIMAGLDHPPKTEPVTEPASVAVLETDDLELPPPV